MVPMAYRSVFRPITRAQWALPIKDLIAPADEGLCNGAIAYAAGRGCRPSSELVARVKGWSAARPANGGHCRGINSLTRKRMYLFVSHRQ